MSTSLSYAATGFGVFACVVVTVFTALAHAPSVPFFWHPITMSLSFLFFMVQGVLALVGKDSIVHVAFELAERKLKIDVHYYLQGLASISYTVGFISIIYNKYAKGSFHFTTWHSWVGLLCGAVCYSQAILGCYLYYTWPKIALSYVMAQRPKDLTLKRWHRALAIVGFALGILTCIVSLWSSFAIKNIPSGISSLLLISFVAIGAATSLIGMRVELPEWMT